MLEQRGPRQPVFGGNDQDAKRGLWERDWRNWRKKIAYALEYTEPEGSLLERLRRFAALAAAGPSSQRELFEIRCDRGANIARALGVSEPTAVAIRAMDEHPVLGAAVRRHRGRGASRARDPG